MTVPEKAKLNWTDLIDKSVHTSDDIDVGDIEAINRDFVVVKRGFVNVHYYYIPMSRVEGWDGNVLWLKVTEEEVERNYQRSKTIPDPARYYIKDFSDYQPKTGYYTSPAFPELPTINPRYMKPPYPVMHPEASKAPTIKYKCDLCNSMFKTEDELNNHVTSSH